MSHETWGAVLAVFYLGLMGNLLACVAALPLVVLLMTTDPGTSWPWIALAAPSAAPAIAALFRVFRDSRDGSPAVVRPYLRAWLLVWRRSMLLGVLVTAVLVVLIVDVRMLSDTPFSVIVVPVLLVLTVVASAAGLLALVAVSEEPTARVRDVVRASTLLAVRQWPFSIVSLVVLCVQVALFANSPALALGLTAAPALYVVWANSRHTLRPVLPAAEASS
ncbi:putative membrane protein YesL [Microbacterium foliorum]|uniref:DUF624 domain-containing protein n=1 Tax=Microbacterium foliorum TaxID=104336 RepID=UPI0020A1CA27|nr:DUF624 domain-containing protein [Microbacterium foliorum]MCP1428160.1 putative membrane protein YesL [Microbacterium foliorum]